MSKSELKAAMQSLQVNKPLKLAGRSPTFIQPIQTLAENRPPAENPPGVPNPTPVGNRPPVQKEAPTVFSTQAEIRPPAPKPTEVANVKTFGADSGSSMSRVTQQDSSVVLEARASEGLKRGYTRLPNTVLMKMANGDLTRGEIKILLLIARFTISFQRKLAPLSKTVLERQSGLKSSSVLEAIASLIDKSLIIKEQGDQHRPNMLGLVLPTDWDQLTGKSETQVENRPPVQNQATVGFSTPALKTAPGEGTNLAPAPAQKMVPFKDISIYFNSLSEFPEVLQKYFSELKPAKKRESEFRAFEELRADYKIQDVADCFALVRSRGVGTGAEPCHSPMAFLSKAINGVLAEVLESRKKLSERSAREQREAEAKRQQATLEAQEATEWLIKEKTFLEAFPEESQRAEVLAEVCKDLPFKLSGEAARVMGIGRWWISKNI